MNRRNLLKKVPRTAAALGLSGTALIALCEAIDAAGCGYQTTNWFMCKYHVKYRIDQWCCTTPSGYQDCTNITRQVPVGSC